MTDEQFDNFLQDACITLNDLWCFAGGHSMGTHELRALNDVLTQFFADKRETNEKED